MGYDYHGSSELAVGLYESLHYDLGHFGVQVRRRLVSKYDIRFCAKS